MRVVTFAVFSRPGEIGSRESWNEQTKERENVQREKFIVTGESIREK